MAFESFSFDEFDVVISVTSAEAKNIITKPHTLHICYCLTPTRYLWSGSDEYLKRPGLGLFNPIVRGVLSLFQPTLKSWDLIAAARPDYYIAISNYVNERIRRYYKKTAECVIYPPVDTYAFNSKNLELRIENKEKYFLCVARLVPYKRVDLVVDAFNKLGWPLIVIGVGREKSRLERQAGATIRFVGAVSDKELAAYYGASRAFVFAGEEDFGIAA